MKLSIFLPHENRSILAFKTISVYHHFLSNSGIDYEILVGEDFSEPSEVRALESISTIKLCKVKERHGGTNGVSAHNTMREHATGDVFIITCAENVPINDHFITQFKQIKNGVYIVGSAFNLGIQATLKILETPAEQIGKINWHATEGGEWFQHSVHNNRCLNFCTMITKSDWDKIGGFNWTFVNSHGFDDDDFLRRIRKAGIEVRPVDIMATVHMNHYGGPYRNGLDNQRRW